MRARIQIWGNSMALRIPKSMAIELKINKGSYVDLSLMNGKLLIDPVKETICTLKDLLKKVSEENVHLEIDTGNPTGKELW